MQIPKFISQIPVQMHQGVKKVSTRMTKAKKFTIKFFKARKDYFVQSDFCKHYAIPFYERNIQPLKKKDYLLLGTMLGVATAVVFLAVKILSVAAFPLAIGCATLIVVGTCSHLRKKVNQHFDLLAWEHVEEIRKIAVKINPQNQKFGEISEQRAKLSHSKFNNRKNEFKQLDEEIRSYKSAILAANYEDRKKIVKTHLTFVKGIVQGHAQDLALIEALEQEVNKTGQKNQDFVALELQKQKLFELQTPTAKDHIADLQKQVNSLVKALQGPSLIDTKISFQKYVEGLQKQLAPYKQ